MRLDRTGLTMRIGIIGGGQLGRMLALAGHPLGLEFLILDRSNDRPAAQVAPSLVGEFTDPKLLRRLARECDLLTFDWENISVESLRALGRSIPIAPSLKALSTARDRIKEKQLFDRLGIPTTRYAAVQSPRSLEQALRQIGLPGVLKTRSLGYDGKGQAVVRTVAEAHAALAALQGSALIYEEFVAFDFEVSAIGARSARGEMALYPLNHNLHSEGILRLTRAPFTSSRLQAQAQGHLRTLLDHFSYCGVLNVEFFVKDGRLLANELAPRVHNSGHWTIEGAVTSQFENHLRAILDLPLGSTRSRGHVAMINLIGELPARDPLLAIPDLHWHDYGKSPRAGRKLGHITLLAENARARDQRARKILKEIDPASLRIWRSSSAS